MSTPGIASTLFSLFQSDQTGSTSTSAQNRNSITNTPLSGDFSSSLALRMASLQAQSVNTLLGSVFTDGKTISSLDFLSGAGSTNAASTDLLSAFGISTGSQGLSSSGRNLSLFDPESAYSMMSLINTRDVTYKAQYSELSAMKTAVTGMQQAGQTLAATSTAMDNEAIKAQLQSFTDKYNAWIKRFDGTVKSDGVLAGTQAAEISLYELEQSVENIFNGARDGFHGLRDLGLSIDQSTNLASLDVSKLDAALAANRQGAINTIDEFSANFARSAELLNSSNNFIPNRLANLDRVIDYISDNKSSLQAEFGLGDPARPSVQTARALAEYKQIFGI